MQDRVADFIADWWSRRWLRRLVIAALVTPVVVALLGFLVAPPVIGLPFTSTSPLSPAAFASCIQRIRPSPRAGRVTGLPSMR